MRQVLLSRRVPVCPLIKTRRRMRRWSLDGPGRRFWTCCGPGAMRRRGKTGRSARTPPWPVATRYGKRKEIYQATVDVAPIRIWLRDPPHDLQGRA